MLFLLQFYPLQSQTISSSAVYVRTRASFTLHTRNPTPLPWLCRQLPTHHPCTTTEDTLKKPFLFRVVTHVETHAEVMALYRSWPAVSQICALMVFPSTWMLRVANSTPIVDLDSRLNSLRVKRESRLLLPTPESPISTTAGERRRIQIHRTAA